MPFFINLFLVSACSFVPADNWPAFLGINASVSTSKELPTKWSPTEGIVWKVATPGHGQSSPVIWGDKVFVTSTEGPRKDNYHVLCLSLIDGTQLWKHTLQNTDPVENSVYVSRAATTPVVDADRIVSFFESGDIIALDHSGKEIWKKSFSSLYGKFKNKFGLSGSPVQTEDKVIVLVDDEGPSYLVALDKATGNEAWKMERTTRTSWSSPSVQTIDNVQQVIVSSAGSVDGYDCATGKLLWSFTDVGGNTGTTPLPAGPGRFFVAASAGRDGGNAELAKKSNMVMQVQHVDGKWTAKPLWLAAEATPSWASPIAHNSCAYWVNRTGVVYCFDLETGALNYKERLKQSCWATPFGFGDRVYFPGKDGLVTTIAAGKAFKSLSENELWDPNAVVIDPKVGASEATEEMRRSAAMFAGPTLYGCAISSGRIVMRTGDTVYCIGK